MDYLTTRGLVLRTTEYKETDRILTVLSADHGLLTMKARGVRSNRSKLKGACQLLTYAEFTVGEAHGFSSITEATAIEMFPELRIADGELGIRQQLAGALELRPVRAHAAGLDGKEPVVIGQDRQDAVRLLIFGCPEDKPPCRQVHRLLPVCSWRMLRVRRPCRADTPPARRSR